MKKSRWADWFLTAGFLGFLALALAVTLIRPKSGWSYYENRNLAHPAELSVETLLDGTFPASVEPVLQDHAAGRNTLMKLSVWVDLHLFHRPVVNQVVPADGMLLGWNPYETPDPAGITAQAEHMAEELAHLRDVVEEYGGHFCYAAVPGQYAYYPDAYPDFLNNREAYTALEVPALTHAMAERGMDLLDMGPVLDTAGNPREYYSMADYHYQFGGAYLTYRAILERLSAELGTELTILDGNSLAVETLAQPLSGLPGAEALRLGGLRGTPDHRPAQGPRPLHPDGQRHGDRPDSICPPRHRHRGGALLPLHGGRCGRDRNRDQPPRPALHPHLRGQLHKPGGVPGLLQF